MGQRAGWLYPRGCQVTFVPLSPTGFPLTVAVRLERYRTAGVDPYGDPLPAVYSPPETIMVFGYSTGGEDELSGATPQRVRFDLTVYAPTAANVSDRDVITVNNDRYEVSGPPRCWDSNPWWSPGLVVVRCKKVEG